MQNLRSCALAWEHSMVLPTVGPKHSGTPVPWFVAPICFCIISIFIGKTMITISTNIYCTIETKYHGSAPADPQSLKFNFKIGQFRTNTLQSLLEMP